MRENTSLLVNAIKEIGGNPQSLNNDGLIKYTQLLSKVIQKKQTVKNAKKILNALSGFNQYAVDTRKSKQTEIIKEDDILSAVIDDSCLRCKKCELKMVSVSYKDGNGDLSQNKHYIYLFDKLNKINYGKNHVEPLRLYSNQSMGDKRCPWCRSGNNNNNVSSLKYINSTTNK